MGQIQPIPASQQILFARRNNTVEMMLDYLETLHSGSLLETLHSGSLLCQVVVVALA
jgi:hypothetical protein